MTGSLLRDAARVAVFLTIIQAHSVTAQGPVVGSPRQGRPVESPRIQGKPILDKPGSFTGVRRESSHTRVVGIVLTTHGTVVPAAGIVLLRSLSTGRVVGQVHVDQFGQFALAGFEPGTYVAEIVDAAGSIITTSPAFTVGLSQVVSVAPIIPANPLSSFAYWATNGTATAVNTATNAGVIAVSEGSPTSPKS